MLTIKSLGLMETRKINERLALAKIAKRLGVRDVDSLRLASAFVFEITRKRNFIDDFINMALKPKSLSEFDLEVQSFLRLYVYLTRITKNWEKIDVREAQRIAGISRSILGWKRLQKVEHILGVLLTQKPTSTLKQLSDEKRVGLSTFHPTWFVKYCFKLFLGWDRV